MEDVMVIKIPMNLDHDLVDQNKNIDHFKGTLGILAPITIVTESGLGFGIMTKLSCLSELG